MTAEISQEPPVVVNINGVTTPPAYRASPLSQGELERRELRKEYARLKSGEPVWLETVGFSIFLLIPMLLQVFFATPSILVRCCVKFTRHVTYTIEYL